MVVGKKGKGVMMQLYFNIYVCIYIYEETIPQTCLKPI